MKHNQTPGEGEREGSDEVNLKVFLPRWLRTELKKLAAELEGGAEGRLTMSHRVKALVELDTAFYAKTGKILDLVEAQRCLIAQYRPDKSAEHASSKFALKVRKHYAALVERGFHPVRLQQLADGEKPTPEEINQVDKALKTLRMDAVENGI